MKPKLVACITLAVSLLVVSGQMWAHHGNSAYDEINVITVKGAVTEFVWSNPHCQIFMDVKDDKGGVVSWSIETQSPGILRRNRWTKSSISPGDQIAVTLAPAKNGAPVGYSGNKLGKILFSDGHVLKTDQR